MKKTLFLILSGSIVIFSIISIISGPVINKTIPTSTSWRTKNCQKLSDEYKNLKENNGDNKVAIEKKKKERNKCNREKAMYGLEYSSLVVDIVCGCVCTILGLIHYFDVGKPFEKVSGIIGLSSGIIGFVLTLVYVCYSGFIFTHHPYEDSNGAKTIFKANDDYSYAKHEEEKIYKCLFSKDNDEDSAFAKYSDLGKKQYNYNRKKLQEFEDQDSKFFLCSGRILDPSACISKEYAQFDDFNSCDTLYIEPVDDINNKYLFDKWITSLIFSCFIIVCDIGLAIFGFLLFKSDGSAI